MDFRLSLPIRPLPKKIKYSDKILFIGSCFSNEIGNRLSALKFNIVQNPTGIIYHPLVIREVLERSMEHKEFTASELFEHNGIFHSWMHHSSFSERDLSSALSHMNQQMEDFERVLRNGNFLFITPATSYGYYLKNTDSIVANCHKMPAASFEKRLTESRVIAEGFKNLIEKLRLFNPNLTIIFTVSPVKHYRDGVVESNISKAGIIIAVQEVLNEHDDIFYFPSYEIMNDELRDYRFYKNDFAHPNEMATDYIMERFCDFAFDDSTKSVLNRVGAIVSASRHKLLFPGSDESRIFARQQLQKIEELLSEFPDLNFREETDYFQKRI